MFVSTEVATQIKHGNNYEWVCKMKICTNLVSCWSYFREVINKIRAKITDNLEVHGILFLHGSTFAIYYFILFFIFFEL